ncbi:hypothetical protein PISMIDRAFT_683371 [Pisolithus microcarpus 441]|uniref:Uncharacterized protein n=1 Tax=Pisolithus microcarpus 441 TaxID=765257 RepID=A0A0C9Y3J5_9AGAM|nr:hypothetical protein PISMIDRAFT_683371 [Pisolithus microcarpus 441]
MCSPSPAGGLVGCLSTQIVLILFECFCRRPPRTCRYPIVGSPILDVTKGHIKRTNVLKILVYR